MDTSQIPALTLPSGGTVEFVDLDDLTGADLHAIRRTIKEQDSGGETTNALAVEGMRLLVKTWDISYLADPRTPEANPAAWKKLKIRDLAALEMAVIPTVMELMNPPVAAAALDDSPGSPTPPASE